MYLCDGYWLLVISKARHFKRVFHAKFRLEITVKADNGTQPITNNQ